MTFADLFSNDAEPLRNPDQGAGTSVLERPETKESPVRDDGGDADRFAHYVSKDRIAESRATGRPVVALCGKVWVPKHDPSKYPVCPDCKRIYEEMTRCDTEVALVLHIHKRGKWWFVFQLSYMDMSIMWIFAVGITM